MSNPFHCQSYQVQTFQWEEGWPILWNNGKNWQTTMGPLYRPKWVQDPIQISSSPVRCSDKAESIFLPVIARRNRRASQETGSGKGSESRNSRFLFPDIPSTEKEWKFRTSNRPFLTKSVHKQTSFQDGDSQVIKTIFMFWYIQYPQITYGSSSNIRSFSPWIFTQWMNVIAAYLRLVPYLASHT